MANICEYKVIEKGKKNACYAFFGSMSVLDNKWVTDESGSNEEFTLRFQGDCKWSVDSYCEPWEGECPVQLPEDAEEAQYEAEEKYWYKTVKDRSRMFGVEVWCNSADVDFPVQEYFEHYISGEDAGGECPEELKVLEDPEEGYARCIACGDEFPEEVCTELDEGIVFCPHCYEEEYGSR